MGTTRYSRNIAPGVTHIEYVRDPSPTGFILGLIIAIAVIIGGLQFIGSVALPALGDAMHTHVHPVLTWVLFGLSILLYAVIVFVTYNRGKEGGKRNIALTFVNGVLALVLILPTLAIFIPNQKLFGITIYNFSGGIGLLAIGAVILFLVGAAIFWDDWEGHWEDKRGAWIAILVGYVVIAGLLTFTEPSPLNGYFGSATIIGVAIVLLNINHGYILSSFRRNG